MWSSKLQQTPPTVSYEEVMDSDDVGLFKWLSNIVSNVSSLVTTYLIGSYRTSLVSRSSKVCHQPLKRRKSCRQELDSSERLNVSES